MDGSAFDDLTKTLTEPRSRRDAHRLVSGLAVGGLLALVGVAEGTARKKKKPCPPCKKRKKGKCKVRLPEGTSCIDTAGQDGTCQEGRCVPSPTCSDGMKNGNESDVDCGGSCGRCPNSKRCTGANDCASAYCASGTCEFCPTHNAACGTAGATTCSCQQRGLTTELYCIDPTKIREGCGAGGSCPSNEVCVLAGIDPTPVCVALCGAS